MKPIVYVLKNTYGLTENQRNFLMSFIGEQRKNRIESVRFQDKGDALLLAEVLLKCAASKEFGVPLSALSVSYNEQGKPFFENHKSLHFSISHYREYVCVALCDCPIGIDIQKIGNFPKKVAERVCSDAEWDLIVSAEDSASLFTKLWTQKEAALKMKGAGIFHGEIRDILNHHETESIQIENYWLSIATFSYDAK